MQGDLRLTIITDTADHVIANASVVSDTPGQAATRQTCCSRSSEDVVLPAALVVGEFEYVEGSVGRIDSASLSATPGKKRLTGPARSRPHSKCLHFSTMTSAIKYPYGKLDMSPA